MGETAEAGLEMQPGEDGKVCRLTGVLDFSTVPALVREIPGLFARPRELTVDLGGVTRVDSAGLSLLLEMQRLAGEGGCSLTLKHAPKSLRNLIHISDLDPFLTVTD
ncbi:MAG: STAS domain-containing protein [Gammaproteobacteria bacterium]